MSRIRYSSGWERFTSTPKKPAPVDGIRVKQLGATWWSKRWIDALVAMMGSARLGRGKTYARTGRVHGLVVDGGAVRAKVTGSGSAPYTVTIALAPLSAPAWAAAIAAMAKSAQFAAALLSSEMPREIDTAFAASGGKRVSLFPATDDDLRTSCSCPDWANPCKHVAATHFVLGEALDRDPFLLFELRGRMRDDVLKALRAARGAATPARAARGRRPAEQEATAPVSVSLHGVSAAAFDAWRAPLPEVALDFRAGGRPGAVLQQLGAPPGWSKKATPADLLGPALRAVTERARQLASEELEEVTQPPDRRSRRG